MSAGCTIASPRCPIRTTPSRPICRAADIPKAEGTGDLPPPGRGALPVWLRSEQAGDGTGEVVAVAGILCRGIAADFPGPPADAWRCADRSVLCVAVDLAGDRRAARSVAGPRRSRSDLRASLAPCAIGWFAATECVDRARHRRSGSETGGQGAAGQVLPPLRQSGTGLGGRGDAAANGTRRRMAGVWRAMSRAPGRGRTR